MAAKAADIEAAGEETPLVYKLDDEEAGQGFLTRSANFLVTLYKVFGYEVLVLIATVQHMQKGFTRTLLLDQVVPYIFKSYHVDAATVQVYSAFVKLPWVSKPAIGIASDVLPLCGLSKAPYIVVTAIVGSVACYFVATSQLSVLLFVICLIGLSTHVATADLLVEAVVAARVKESPVHGPSLLSFLWGGLLMSSFAATVVAGVVLEYFQPKALFNVGAMCSLVVLIPVALGFLGEKRRSVSEQEMLWSRFSQCKELLAIPCIIVASAITIMTLPLLLKSRLMIWVGALCIGLITLFSCSVAFTPVVARALVFVLIVRAVSVNIDSATFYFFTDTEAQYPLGPHFTPFFYNTLIGGVNAFAQVVGVSCYNRFMSEWKYRDAIAFCALLTCALQVCPLIMYSRLNLALGIPDHFFVFGCSVVESMFTSLDIIPIAAMIMHMCPKDFEATMYATMTGVGNLGFVISSYGSAYIMERVSVLPSGMDSESAQFENLWKLALLHAACALFPLCVLGLLPDARQNEALLSLGAVTTDSLSSTNAVTSGSLWRRCWNS